MVKLQPLLTREQLIERNLEVVGLHMEREVSDLDAAMALYTDDVVWEAPARGVVCQGAEQIKAVYRDLFASLRIHTTTTLLRTANEEWVFNDKILTVTVVDDRIPNLPFPVGAKLSVRKLGAFQLRDGLICREISHEAWRPIDGPTAHDDIPRDAHTVHHGA
ncbi:nuclear transport factor 2 family protein [Streptomyces sp. HUAS TT7]|uniref:nuclear transport factor 2 family protein n=1 Tax=Streptomyces sp. HUAS TT7 TaxID=3447507 RepID=UPI003F660A5E